LKLRGERKGRERRDVTPSDKGHLEDEPLLRLTGRVFPGGPRKQKGVGAMKINA